MRWKMLNNEIHRIEIITRRGSWSFIEMFTERATAFSKDTIRISTWCRADGKSIYTSSFQLLFRISTAHFLTSSQTLRVIELVESRKVFENLKHHVCLSVFKTENLRVVISLA